MNKFISKGHFTKEAIGVLSKENGITVDIVIGKLQAAGKISYNKYRGLRTFINKVELTSIYYDLAN